MSMNLHFELPRALILNANTRMHWAPKAAITRNLRYMGKIAARGCEPMDRAHLTIHVGWPDQRRRDVANLTSIKPLLDGIIDAGLLPDDDDAHLIGPDLRPYTAGKTGLIVLDFVFQSVDDKAESPRKVSAKPETIGTAPRRAATQTRGLTASTPDNTRSTNG